MSENIVAQQGVGEYSEYLIIREYSVHASLWTVFLQKYGPDLHGLLQSTRTSATDGILGLDAATLSLHPAIECAIRCELTTHETLVMIIGC